MTDEQARGGWSHEQIVTAPTGQDKGVKYHFQKLNHCVMPLASRGLHVQQKNSQRRDSWYYMSLTYLQYPECSKREELSVMLCHGINEGGMQRFSLSMLITAVSLLPRSTSVQNHADRVSIDVWSSSERDRIQQEETLN